MHNNPLLTEEQKNSYREFCEFAQEHVQPNAAEWDKGRGVPREVIGLCSEAGFVGGIFPKESGGGGWDAVTFGLINEAMGAASSSLCALFTVQTMAGTVLAKWGTDEQRKKWLEPMAKGEKIASFALTEPGMGSDIQAVETTFTPNGDGYLLNGTKKWITFSAMADILLVFGKDNEDKSMACVIPSDAPGVEVIPLKDMLGFRGAHLGRIELKNVGIDPANVVGKPGLVMKYVAPYGLHYGRMSTAWSAAGLLRACMETSASYASERRAFGRPIMEHGMIRHIITDMGVDLEAARHFCLSASMANDSHSPAAIEKTLIAKYFTTQAAVRAASNTVQIMGAAGCHEDNPAARYYRNSKITEIIEGTTQIHQEILGKSFCRKFAKKKPKG